MKQLEFSRIQQSDGNRKRQQKTLAKIGDFVCTVKCTSHSYQSGPGGLSGLPEECFGEVAGHLQMQESSIKHGR